MELGQESSTRSGPTIDQRLITQAPVFRRQSAPRDLRLPDLDLRILGESRVMRILKTSILTAADCSSTVLITGESGTGKELIARSIHDLGPRGREPFLAINCGALTESLLESELFGHVKGAFTGATAYKKGMFEAAGRGTIFLDEFGEMSSSMQVRLLRVLQERRVRPVGSEESREIKFDARVIVATNRDLKHEVAAGRFRQDLYYRVNVFPIRSPSLRDRIDDLPVLIDRILKRLIDNSALGCNLQFESAALTLLQDYRWPGNVRELENVIERLAISSADTGVVTGSDVSSDLRSNGLANSGFVPEAQSRGDELREIILSKELKCLSDSRATVRHLSKRQELDLYLRELAQASGDVKKAAQRLGIKRTTLHMRIKRLQTKLELDRDLIGAEAEPTRSLSSHGS